MSGPTLPEEPGPDDFGPEERDELLAAEYVLGTLPADDWRVTGLSLTARLQRASAHGKCGLPR